MNQKIELNLDETGHLITLIGLQSFLGLSPGTTLIVEAGDEGELRLRVQTEAVSLNTSDTIPQTTALSHKNGVLIAQVEAVADLSDFVRKERDHRIAGLIEQTERP